MLGKGKKMRNSLCFIVGFKFIILINDKLLFYTIKYGFERRLRMVRILYF